MIYFFVVEPQSESWSRFMELSLEHLLSSFNWMKKKMEQEIKKKKIVEFDCLEGGRIKSSVVNAILHSIRAKKIGPHMLQYSGFLNSIWIQSLLKILLP